MRYRPILTGVVLTFILTACGSTTQSAPSSTSAAPTSAAPTSDWIGLVNVADPSCETFNAAPRDEREHYAVTVYLALLDKAGYTYVPQGGLVTDWSDTLISSCEGSTQPVGTFVVAMWTGYRGKYQP